MLDLIGAIAVTAAYVTIAAVLIGFSTANARQKGMIAVAAALWGIGVVSVAALGGFAPGATGPVPAPLFPFAGLVLLLFGAWFLYPGFRRTLLSVPLPALVALNIARVGGVFFLILAADGRLSEEFAQSAGWGDITTGLLAIPLAVMAGHQSESSRTPLLLWNIFGSLDLIAAITLGVLSAPGTPFQVFTEEPGTFVMAQLPWIVVPAILVPVYLLIHLTIATKLNSSHRVIANSSERRLTASRWRKPHRALNAER